MLVIGLARREGGPTRRESTAKYPGVMDREAHGARGSDESLQRSGEVCGKRSPCPTVVAAVIAEIRGGTCH